MPAVGKELGEVLVAKGLLKSDDWLTVQSEHEKTGEPFRSILARFGFATEEQLKDALEVRYGVPYFSLARAIPQDSTLNLLPIKLVREFRAIPVGKDASSLAVAMANPHDLSAVKSLKEYLKAWQVKLMVCTEDDIAKFIEMIDGVSSNPGTIDAPSTSKPASATLTTLPAAAAPGLISQSQQKLPVPSQADSLSASYSQSDSANSAPTKLAHSDNDASLMLLANELISKAIEIRCSDMHVEPEEDEVVLRYLKDKKLLLESKIPKSVHPELVFCYKVIAGLNLNEAAKPQDKRAKIKIGDRDVEFRVTTIPGEFGETVAISFKFDQ